MSEHTSRERVAQERLAACWNACEGIPTLSLQPELLKNLLKAFEDINNAFISVIPLLPAQRHRDTAETMTQNGCLIVETIRGGVPYVNDNQN